MIKMVVSSFYNALINYEEAIPVSTMLEIERIRKKGIVFSVCTNNNYQEVLDYNRDFPFLDYIIALNGALIYDVLKKEIIYKKKLNKKNIAKIEKLFNPNLIKYYKYQNDIYKIDIDITDTNFNLKDLESVNKNIFIKNNRTYLEITSILTDNYQALERIITKKNISKEEVLALVANDADLVLATNLPKVYIMENASDTLCLTKHQTTTSNNNGGVSKVLKEI